MFRRPLGPPGGRPDSTALVHPCRVSELGEDGDDLVGIVRSASAGEARTAARGTDPSSLAVGALGLCGVNLHVDTGSIAVAAATVSLEDTFCAVRAAPASSHGVSGITNFGWDGSWHSILALEQFASYAGLSKQRRTAERAARDQMNRAARVPSECFSDASPERRLESEKWTPNGLQQEVSKTGKRGSL